MKILRPLVILDLETTGVWLPKDKVIEIALLRYEPDGTRSVFEKKVQPGIPIPDKVIELTGISNEDVKTAPRFYELAEDAFQFIGDADLAGFNIERFDLPMLEKEFRECGLNFEWKDRKIYDAQKVFHLNEKRDLSAAYEFYCSRKLEGAHSALVDSEAVYDILIKQVEKYGDGSDELAVLDQFDYESHFEYYDQDKKVCWRDDELYLMFGKYAKKLTLKEICDQDEPYLRWILKSDFSDEIKDLVGNAIQGRFPQREKKNQ